MLWLKSIPQHKYKWTIISCSHPINRAAVLIEKAHLTYSKLDQQMYFQGYYQLCVFTIKVFLYPIWIFAHPFPQKCPTHDLFHWPVSAYLWWQIKLSCTYNAGANSDREQASGFREYLLSQKIDSNWCTLELTEIEERFQALENAWIMSSKYCIIITDGTLSKILIDLSHNLNNLTSLITTRRTWCFLKKW